MATVIQPDDKAGKRSRLEQTDEGRAFSDLSFEERLSTLYQEHRVEDRNGRLALNRAWFASSLYYQGKQRVAYDPDTGSLMWYDRMPGEDYYVENQYRKDVNANMATLIRSQIQPEPRPSSENPEDIAAASKAKAALHVIEDDVAEKRLKVKKSLYLTLYGNAFRYNGFEYDEKNGVEQIPRFKYEDVEIAGVDICPECGTTVETNEKTPVECPECGAIMELVSQTESLPTKVEDGFEERTKGRNISHITGPLEMYARSKCTELSNQPYLFWVRRLDAETVKHFRPKAEIGTATMGSTGSGDADLSQYYIDVLSTLAGGPIEGTYEASGERYYREVEYSMCWIRPESFKGDTELKRKFPDGVQFEVVNGTYIKETARNISMDKCWTHYIYLLNPYSFWGDGMVDALPMQDQINETGSLLTRHLRFSTLGKKIYDQEMITPAWLSNNPGEEWIPANRQLEKSIREAVFEVNPTPLSGDVGAWMVNQHQAMRDMSRSYNPFQRGANTPYSADVFQAEQAAGQFLPTVEYNQESLITSCHQQLDLFRENVTEERSSKFKDNTGRWSHEKFRGADLASGSFDIYIAQAESMPRTKAEKVAGLELFTNIAPMLGGLSQKQKIYVLDICGLPADANPDTAVSQKAYRDIESIIKRNEDVTPNMFILGEQLPIYIKTIREYLMSEEGDELAIENADSFVKVHDLMITSIMMAQMQTAGMPPMDPEQAAAAGGPGGPGDIPNMGTPPKPPEPELAQAPVPEDQKIPMPPLPPGVRQGT
jgi:rubrerythrin